MFRKKSIFNYQVPYSLVIINNAEDNVNTKINYVEKIKTNRIM